MRALLASPLGFLVGLSLGALGGGGSILAVPALVHAAGQDPRAATASSLLLVGSASLVGMGSHLHAGRVRVATGVVFGLAGIGGSVAGSALNRHLDADLLLLGFAGLVAAAAWRMVTGCPTCTAVGDERALAASNGSVATLVRRQVDVRAVLTVVVAGSLVGFLTGLFGVGGGFVIVPALALGLRLPMPEAIGTSLLVVTINCGVALTARMATTTIDWAVTVPFAVAAVAGVLAGGRIAHHLDPARSVRWFAALLVAVAVATAVDAGLALT